jgi:hypothetical protein
VRPLCDCDTTAIAQKLALRFLLNVLCAADRLRRAYKAEMSGGSAKVTSWEDAVRHRLAGLRATDSNGSYAFIPAVDAKEVGWVIGIMVRAELKRLLSHCYGSQTLVLTCVRTADARRQDALAEVRHGTFPGQHVQHLKGGEARDVQRRRC